MKIISLSRLSQARDTIRNGGLVIFPSDTVYGLLADATNEKAVEKLTAFKNRPAGKPTSVFVSDKNIKSFVELDIKQEKTLEALLPGPFTIILKSKHKVSKKLESEKGTLGIRIPDYKPINKLVEEIGRPITATSANVSGGSPHHSIESLLKHLPSKKRKLIDLVVDGGKLPRNKPSTIIDLTTPSIKVLRHGDIKLSDSKSYISNSPGETKKIAQNLLKRSLTKKPLIFILQGELGVGKTIFVKGIGEFLGVDNIISPTFVIYYEYDIKKSGNEKLIHVDLYNLEDAEEFKHLGLERYLQSRNIFCFEWGEKAEPLIDKLRKKGDVFFVKMKYIDERTRKLIISRLS